MATVVSNVNCIILITWTKWMLRSQVKDMQDRRPAVIIAPPKACAIVGTPHQGSLLFYFSLCPLIFLGRLAPQCICAWWKPHQFKPENEKWIAVDRLYTYAVCRLPSSCLCFRKFSCPPRVTSCGSLSRAWFLNLNLPLYKVFFSAFYSIKARA